jgi:hypothetical protein
LTAAGGLRAAPLAASQDPPEDRARILVVDDDHAVDVEIGHQPRDLAIGPGTRPSAPDAATL